MKPFRSLMRVILLNHLEVRRDQKREVVQESTSRRDKVKIGKGKKSGERRGEEKSN